VIYGCILILFVAVAPRGVAGILSDLRQRVLAPTTALAKSLRRGCG
jgi:hypothetical protein